MTAVSIVDTTDSMTCWSDACRHEHGTVRLLSIYGHANTVRGMWARLRDGRFMRVQGTEIHTPKDESYGKCQQVLEKAGKLDTLQIVVYDSRITVAGSRWEPYMYLLSYTPMEAMDRWLDRFAPLCKVPIDPAWSRPLWLRGVEAGAIVPLDGFGPLVFKINRETETWLPLVQGMLGFTPSEEVEAA